MTIMAVETTAPSQQPLPDPVEIRHPKKGGLLGNIPSDALFEGRSYFGRMFSSENSTLRTIAHVGQLQRSF
jgi:hypothetical protein